MLGDGEGPAFGPLSGGEAEVAAEEAINLGAGEAEGVLEGGIIDDPEAGVLVKEGEGELDAGIGARGGRGAGGGGVLAQAVPEAEEGEEGGLEGTIVGEGGGGGWVCPDEGLGGLKEGFLSGGREDARGFVRIEGVAALPLDLKGDGEEVRAGIDDLAPDQEGIKKYPMALANLKVLPFIAQMNSPGAEKPDGVGGFTEFKLLKKVVLDGGIVSAEELMGQFGEAGKGSRHEENIL